MYIEICVDGGWRSLYLHTSREAESLRKYPIRPAQGHEDQFTMFYGTDYGPSPKGSAK